MSAFQTIKEILPVSDDESVDSQMYECQNCLERFESAKDRDQAQCPDCLADEVEPVETEPIETL